MGDREESGDRSPRASVSEPPASAPRWMICPSTVKRHSKNDKPVPEDRRGDPEHDAQRDQDASETARGHRLHRKRNRSANPDATR